MRIVVDASAAHRAGVKLVGAKRRIQAAAAKTMFRLGEDAVTYIKREFRSGPTTSRTTQIRTNRLRSSYSQRTQPEGNGIGVITDVGLMQAGQDVLRYGRLMEGYDASGHRFTQKTIRAKAGGWLTFPIFNPDTPGMARTNIVGWVRKRSVVFRPRPSFDATAKKFQPIMQREVADIIAREAADVA